MKSVFSLLKNLFAKPTASPTIQEIASKLENTVTKTIEAPVTAKMDSLGNTVSKLKDKVGISHEIEARPGYRKFRTLNGDTITVEAKDGYQHIHTTDRIPRSNSTLEITRDVCSWNKLKESEFLGLRRDSVWGKDGLTKTTTLQTTGTTLPIGTSRELRPEYGSLAHRDGWRPTIEYPQICPKTNTTTVTKPSQVVEHDFSLAMDRDIKQWHDPNGRYYTGSKYNDCYAEYRAPMWNPF